MLGICEKNWTKWEEKRANDPLHPQFLPFVYYDKKHSFIHSRAEHENALAFALTSFMLQHFVSWASPHHMLVASSLVLTGQSGWPATNLMDTWAGKRRKEGLASIKSLVTSLQKCWAQMHLFYVGEKNEQNNNRKCSGTNQYLSIQNEQILFLGSLSLFTIGNMRVFILSDHLECLWMIMWNKFINIS